MHIAIRARRIKVLGTAHVPRNCVPIPNEKYPVRAVRIHPRSAPQQPPTLILNQTVVRDGIVVRRIQTHAQQVQILHAAGGRGSANTGLLTIPLMSATAIGALMIEHAVVTQRQIQVGVANVLDRRKFLTGPNRLAGIEDVKHAAVIAQCEHGAIAIERLHPMNLP